MNDATQIIEELHRMLGQVYDRLLAAGDVFAAAGDVATCRELETQAVIVMEAACSPLYVLGAGALA